MEIHWRPEATKEHFLSWAEINIDNVTHCYARLGSPRGPLATEATAMAGGRRKERRAAWGRSVLVRPPEVSMGVNLLVV